MENLSLILFIISIGFTLAAILSNLVQLKAEGSDGFDLPINNVARMLVLFILCMFSGPYLVARGSLNYFIHDQLPLYILFGSFAITILWSLCSGILIVQLLAIIGVIGV